MPGMTVRPPRSSDARLRAPQGERAARVAGERDAPAAHGERLDERTGIVDRVDARVGDDEIGGGLLCGERQRRRAARAKKERMALDMVTWYGCGN